VTESALVRDLRAADTMLKTLCARRCQDHSRQLWHGILDAVPPCAPCKLDKIKIDPVFRHRDEFRAGQGPAGQRRRWSDWGKDSDSRSPPDGIVTAAPERPCWP